MLESYLKPFFAFAVSRTDNSVEAEELAQEIVFQAVSALSKPRTIDNPEAFIWSIAHNTYKCWLARRHADKNRMEFDDTFGNLMKPIDFPESRVLEQEDICLLRRELSLLTGNYRKTIVDHYYKGLTCQQIAGKIGISIEMVKFYLSAGRKRLREGMEMLREFGEKSFNPSVFNIYKSGWSTINIWPLFARRLPGNIVLASYDKPTDIQELSIETGVPAAFLEDEVRILTDAGLMRDVSKGRYQTAFFIADADLISQIETASYGTVTSCVKELEEAFRRVLPTMKSQGLFAFDAPENRYKWLFMQLQRIFGIPFSTDYPRVLSDGSENFIWGEEAEQPLWSGGRTPYEKPDHIVEAIDIVRLGSSNQESLRCKGSALADLARGTAIQDRTEEYAALVRDGYAVRINGSIHLNIPVFTPESNRRVRMSIDEATYCLRESIDIQEMLRNIGGLIAPRMTKLVQGKPEEYAALILSVHIESYLMQAMHEQGYLPLPDAGDNSPMTSFLVLR